MDSVAIWFECSEFQDEGIARTSLRQSSNIFNLNDESFVKNFRLTKEAFIYVLQEISSELKEPKRSHAISAETKLATALKFLGQGGYQHQIGQDRNTGLTQSSVSLCLTEVCAAIEKVLCPKHIIFAMTSEEKARAKHNFFAKTGIPGVIMAVDGTHIQMVRPTTNEHLYFNRKLKHSVNAMVICDDQMRLRGVNARYGGASHDSHIWSLSEERQYLKNLFDNGERSSWLLGDSGYPLEPWLLTPYRNAPENSAESYFNMQFSKGRCIIERTIGVLKGHFRCLLAARELHYSPLKVVSIFNACCALHNICLEFKVPEPTIEIEIDLGLNFADVLDNLNGNYRNIAMSLRDEIKRNLR